MAKFEKHYSMQAAERVIKALKSMLADKKYDVTILAWSNGREQGYCLRVPAKENFDFTVNIAQQRNSDYYLVIPSIGGKTHITTNMPEDACWEQSREFQKATQAAAWIVELFAKYAEEKIAKK